MTDKDGFQQPDWCWNDVTSDMKDIIGKVPVHIEQGGDEQITFWFSDGSVCRWYHHQNCCESVDIEDVNGEWTDLLNTPLIVAEERKDVGSEDYGSYTWTFYTFRSVNGSVDVRWYGYSNGYYSERVDFEMIA